MSNLNRLQTLAFGRKKLKWCLKQAGEKKCDSPVIKIAQTNNLQDCVFRQISNFSTLFFKLTFLVYDTLLFPLFRDAKFQGA